MYERHQQEQNVQRANGSLPSRKRKRTRSDSRPDEPRSDFSAQLEALDWGKEVTKKSKDLERKAAIALAKSDRQTSDLYRLNRRINDLFCKIMVEKSQKEATQSPDKMKQVEKNASGVSTDKIKQMENDLRLLREKHRTLVRTSKKSLLQAKRLFTMSKRVSDGYSKSELDENTERFRKGCKKNVGRECPVCIDIITCKDRSLQVNQCKHVMHEECFDSWIDCHTTCPACRTQLEPQVGEQELPQQITDTISWADMTTTNISAI